MKGYCTFLELGRYGRFANQIFQIAGTIGIARKNGLEPVFPLWTNHDHKDRFGSKEDVDLWKHFINPLPVLPEGVTGYQTVNVQWGYHDLKLNSRQNWGISGHLQSYKYFSHCIEEVRKYMTMKNEFPRNKCVAMHVRRGDYDDKYHPRLSVEYYARATLEFPVDTTYHVFSDDIVAVHDEFVQYFTRFLTDITYAQGLEFLKRRFRFVNYDEPMYDYIESFKLMKSCSGFIIGNSSYSAAAAMLSDAPGKKVVAPRNWFGQAYAGINANDIYCEDWIVI